MVGYLRENHSRQGLKLWKKKLNIFFSDSSSWLLWKTLVDIGIHTGFHSGWNLFSKKSKLPLNSYDLQGEIDIKFWIRKFVFLVLPLPHLFSTWYSHALLLHAMRTDHATVQGLTIGAFKSTHSFPCMHFMPPSLGTQKPFSSIWQPATKSSRLGSAITFLGMLSPILVQWDEYLPVFCSHDSFY